MSDKVAVSDRLEKHQILGRLPHNLATVEALIEENEQVYGAAFKTRSERRRWYRPVRASMLSIACSAAYSPYTASGLPPAIIAKTA